LLCISPFSRTIFTITGKNSLHPLRITVHCAKGIKQMKKVVNTGIKKVGAAEASANAPH